MADVPAGLATALADRYRLERELGQGGMATVYLAHDLRHERQVAIKVLRPELAAVIGAERFLREIKTIASLQHPHILGLIDSGEVQGTAYFVMPFVDGESLRDRLTRETQLSLDETLRITGDVASALEYSHRHGVIHRDIKPENILLAEGGALLADFGIALAGAAGGAERLTETGASLGTPAYMSPEQATGERTLGPPSDIFSLGVVVYEMLAGEAPYTGPTAKAVLAKVVLGQPTPLSVVRPGLPDHVEQAIRRALSKTPADRFATPPEFVEALRRPAAATRFGAPRVRRLGTAALVASLAILGGLWWLRGRRPAPVPVTTQLTFTGKATLPALSPDGSRVAYVAEECSAGGLCSSSILISDTSGAGALPVVRGRVAIDDIEWTTDGRFLLFSDLGSAEMGLFVVSTLGGPPRSLGCCGGGLLDGMDTALVMKKFDLGTDSIAWVRLVTLADGVARDSLRVPGRSTYPFALGSPDGRRIGVADLTPALWTVRILDRSGRQLDSLSHEYGQYVTIRWTPSGDALLATNERGDGQGYDLLRFRVNTAGRISRKPDTLLRQLPMSFGHVRLNGRGGLVYASETRDQAVYALTRERGPKFRFTSHRLALTTGRLLGLVSPGGEQVLLKQSARRGGPAVVSIMPFDSGPAVPIGPPVQDLEDLDWTAEGREVLLARRREDRVIVSQAGPASGQSREIGSFVAAPTKVGLLLTAIPGGGGLGSMGNALGCDLYLVGVPGMRDTVIHAPAPYECPASVAPDGRTAIVLDDTGRLVAISLTDGHTALLSSVTLPGIQVLNIKWLADRTIVVVARESEQTIGWYALVAGGAQFKRVGTLPLGFGYYSLSADGRRVVASIIEPRRDVVLIGNFGDLLQARR
jgi:hypothetical protein